jgi:hypothetical protein
MDPYKPPEHLRGELTTSEERQEFLAWYKETQPLRDKQSATFYNGAGFWLLFSFFAVTVVPLAMIIGHKVMERF